MDRPTPIFPPSAKGKAKANFKATIPVYFHVVTAGTTGALTDAQIARADRRPQQHVRGRRGRGQDRLQFKLAGVTRTDNAAWFYAGPGGNNEHSMKAALHQGGPDALNFYTTTAGDFLGWAYLPDIVTKPGQAYLDGVVVDWESLPGTSTTYAGRYDQGETGDARGRPLAEPRAHVLRRLQREGRLRRRHARRAHADVGLPGGEGHLPRAGRDPIHNYMDYSYDSCYTQFTAGQTQRMRDAWLLYRNAATLNTAP